MPTPSAPSPTETGSRTRTDLSEAIGWLLVAAITLAVLATWAPSFGAGLGDNHEGRILARHALNVQNAQQDGLAASGWLSDWSPYAGRPEGDQTRYAHHPPLMNLGYYLTAEVLPLRLDISMRLFSYLTGVAILPLGAAVLRRLGLPWVATLVATSAVAVTPLFWVYGRLSGAVTLLVAMMLVIVRLREDRPVGNLELVIASVVTLSAVVAGYLGMVTAALLGLALLAARGLDRVTVVIGAVMASGATITAAYVLGGTGADGVGDQIQMRTQGGDFTTTEFLQRIGEWATALLPFWWLYLLLPLALAAGLVERRTRLMTAILTIVAVGYIFGLPNGSFIHDYWIFPILLPAWIGAAALLDAADARLQRHGVRGPALVGALIVTLGVTGIVRDDVPQRYLSDPEAAGELARTTRPADGQTVAWRISGLAAPRWLSLYWDLPPAQVARSERQRIGDDDLVFVALDRTPGWLDAEQVRASARAIEGSYATITGATLRRIEAQSS